MFFTTRNVLATLSGVCDIRKLPLILSFVFCITRSILVWSRLFHKKPTFCFFFQVNFVHRECVFCITKMCNFIKCILYHKICVCYVEMFCFPKKYAFLLVTFSSVFCNANLLAVLSGVFCIARFCSGFYSFIRKSKR